MQHDRQFSWLVGSYEFTYLVIDILEFTWMMLTDDEIMLVKPVCIVVVTVVTIAANTLKNRGEWNMPLSFIHRWVNHIQVKRDMETKAYTLTLMFTKKVQKKGLYYCISSLNIKVTTCFFLALPSVISGIFQFFQLFLAHCSGWWLSWSLEVWSAEPGFLALRAVQLSVLTFHTFHHII